MAQATINGTCLSRRHVSFPSSKLGEGNVEYYEAVILDAEPGGQLYCLRSTAKDAFVKVVPGQAVKDYSVTVEGRARVDAIKVRPMGTGTGDEAF